MEIPRLILASQSPRRRVLFRQVGYHFRVIPSNVKEDRLDSEPPAAMTKRIAFEKAADVARRVKRGIVVGADTIVVLGDRVLGKPKSKREAVRMLKLLSGNTHTVFTAFALLDAETHRKTVQLVKTRVKFRLLDNKEITHYVDSGSPMDKAGAYGIQDDYGAVFVEEVYGCFYAVVGFPLAKFHTTLMEFIRKQ
ncbi:MAG: Maf family protein [bacterium]